MMPPMTIGGLDNMKEKKKITPIRIIIDVLFFGVVGFMVLCFTWNFIDIRSGYKYPLFGQRTTVIVSPSMATVNDANKDYITEDMKQIQKYDVITTKDYKSFDDVKIYDIATYYTGKELICHRVVKKYESEGKQYIIFRGDANNVDDTPVSFELLRGKVTKITPKVGHVVAFFQSPYLFIALFGTLFFVFLGMFIITYKKDKKEPVKEVEEPKQEEPVKDEAPQEEQPAEESPKEEAHEEPAEQQENNKEEIPNDNKE